MKNTRLKSPTRTRRNTTPVHFENTGQSLIGYAGLIPVIKFLDKKLNFTGLFNSCVGHQRAANAQYCLSDVVFLLMTSIIGGARSISKCAALWSDGVLRQIIGWIQVPDETTIGRILKETKESNINDMETLVHTCRKHIWQLALRAGTSKIAALCNQWNAAVGRVCVLSLCSTSLR